MWYRRQGFQDTPGSAGWGLTRHQPRHADRDHRSCVSRRVCARDQRPPRRSDAIASCICRQRVTAETVMRLLAAPCRVARPIRWKAKRSSTISRKVLLRAKLQWGRRQQATESFRQGREVVPPDTASMGPSPTGDGELRSPRWWPAKCRGFNGAVANRRRRGRGENRERSCGVLRALSNGLGIAT